MLKAAAKHLLGSLGYTIGRKHRASMPDASRQAQIDQYVSGGRVPWSTGYWEYRESTIEQILNDSDLMRRFRARESLPDGFGVALDERCIEYPWMFSSLEKGCAKVLDAGSVLNHVYLLDRPEVRQWRLTIATLAPELDCHWRRGISYVYEDLRDLPFKDNLFHICVCISTLEHVGFDNSQFGVAGTLGEENGDDFRLAVREMRRVLRPGGRLCLTVPFGFHREFQTFQLFNPDLISAVVEEFHGEYIESQYFRYRESGWNIARVEECVDAEYEPWIMTPFAQRPAAFPDSPDRAPAARSVACVMLVK